MHNKNWANSQETIKFNFIHSFFKLELQNIYTINEIYHYINSLRIKLKNLNSFQRKKVL